MHKAEELRRHAEECRVLARRAQNNEHRLQLLKMAESWEALAAARERLVQESKDPVGGDAKK